MGRNSLLETVLLVAISPHLPTNAQSACSLRLLRSNPLLHCILEPDEVMVGVGVGNGRQAGHIVNAREQGREAVLGLDLIGAVPVLVCTGQTCLSRPLWAWMGSCIFSTTNSKGARGLRKMCSPSSGTRSGRRQWTPRSQRWSPSRRADA